MPHFAVSAIGRDRPGIAAGLSRALLEVKGNIEDAQMSILRGHFAVMLVVAMPEGTVAANLQAALEPVAKQLGLEAVAVNPVDELDAGAAAASHVLTVYGADHPGIVNSVCEALAERSVNVTDMQTRLTGEGDNPLYVMMLEISLPGGTDEAQVRSALEQAGSRAGVEVSLRELEAEAL